MSHRDPTPHDAPLPDADAAGYTATPHYAPPLATTGYQVWHHEHPIGPVYSTMSEAELFRVFETPGTDDYTVRPVRVETPAAPRTTTTDEGDET